LSSSSNTHSPPGEAGSTAPDEDAIAGILEAFRLAGWEPQLTQIIAAFARVDEQFAARLAALLVEAAPYADGCPALRGAIKQTAKCAAEQGLEVGEPREKYPDLTFYGDDWALLVELKIGADYHGNQLRNYLRGGPGLEKEQWALMSVKRDRGRSPEEPDGEPNWLGAVRWKEIRDLLPEIAPQDPVLEPLWRAFVRVESENGDFGMTEFDPDLIHAWATWKKARTQLRGLLGELVEPTRDALRRNLPEGRDVAIQGPWATTETVYLQIMIPESGPERLRIEFYPYEDEACFWISESLEQVGLLLPESQRAYREVAERLCAQSRFVQKDRWRSRTYRESEWIQAEADATVSKLIELIEADVAKLCAWASSRRSSTRQLTPTPEHWRAAFVIQRLSNRAAGSATPSRVNARPSTARAKRKRRHDRPVGASGLVIAGSIHSSGHPARR
jgi:hypothetical protein